MKKLLLMMLLVAGCFMNANAYDLWIAGVKIETEGQITGSAITRGKVSYNNNTKTLTLDNAVIESQTDPAIESNIDGLTIEIIKECFALSYTNTAISLGANTTIKGTWDKTSPHPEFIIHSVDRIGAGVSALSKNMKLTFSKDVYTRITGSPGIEMNPEGSNLILDDCYLHSDFGIRNVSSCTMIKSDFEPYNYLEYVYFNADKKTFTNLEGKAVGVYIGSVSEEYPVQIMGKKLNNVNCRGFYAEGMTSGKITYDPNSSPRKLTLDGVTLTSGKANVSAIKISDTSNMTEIETNGNNSITAAGFVLYLDNAENVYITTGENTEGTTTFKSTGLSAIYSNSKNTTTIYTAQDLYLEGIGTTGSSYAYWGSGGSLILNKHSNNAKVYMKGQSGILKNTEFVLSVMDFYYSRHNSIETPGCYYDNGQVYQNGGTEVKNRYVCFGPILKRYELWVGGTQVTDCNQLAIGSKYITNGGGEAVAYIGGKLILNNATIDTGDDDVNAIKNNAVDGLIIKSNKKANKIITASTGYNLLNIPIYIGANTTISGDASLTITGYRPIMVLNNATLTFQDASDVVLPRIEASLNTSTSQLHVNNSSLTANHDGVLLFADVTWKNCQLTTPAGGHYDTTNRYFVDSNGNKASKVVFAKGLNGVAINETNFPDPYFRQYVFESFDENGDWWLTEEELSNVTDVVTNGDTNITDLTGIQYFKDLWQLDCTDNPLGTLEVIGFTELEQLYCFGCQLTSLDISGCPKLNYIDCSNNEIQGEEMDALIASLPETGGHIVAIELTTEKNVMTKEQVAAANAKGWTVYAYSTDTGESMVYEGVDPGVAINATNFPDDNFRAWLLAQSYGEDGYLTNEEIEDVKCIYVDNCDISDLTGIGIFKNLNEFYCSGNRLTSLDVSNFNALRVLRVYCNSINGEDMSRFIESLPVASSGSLFVVDMDNKDEKNEISSEQAAAAKAKGWYVFVYYNSSWMSYDYYLTGIDTTLMDPENMDNGKWYSLSGQQLEGKPTQKGVYIVNGKKVVMK